MILGIRIIVESVTANGTTVAAGMKVAPAGSSKAILQGVDYIRRIYSGSLDNPSFHLPIPLLALPTLTQPCTSHRLMSNERRYVDLLFRASKKFASWDPEKHLEVGDWGRLATGHPFWAFWRPERCVFVKEGNIYQDKIAEKYGIPLPKVLGEENPNELTWVTSLNVRDMDVSTSMGKQTPELAECSVKVGFQFVSGGGEAAVLIMVNDSVTTIDPATSLRQLLGEEALRDRVVVSEAHRCASYASYLASSKTKDVVIGLSSKASEGSSSTQPYPRWVRTNKTGYFKGKADNSGERKYYPLYKLVSVKAAGGNTGRHSLDSTVNGEVPPEVLPLPDALPLWMSST